MISEKENQYLTVLEQTKVITTADKNLRSKINSILRSLENLSQKKARIEFEIKRQKKSLLRKREELKKVSTSNQKKISISLESGNLIHPDLEEQDLQSLRRLDLILLQESNRLLDD